MSRRQSSEGARPLCVLSSGRSGTSLAARVLNLMGVDLGPESAMLEAGDMNARGYWENRQIMALNDAILERLGGTLFRPPPLPSGWQRDPQFDELRTRVDEVWDALVGDAPPTAEGRPAASPTGAAARPRDDSALLDPGVRQG